MEDQATYNIHLTGGEPSPTITILHGVAPSPEERQAVIIPDATIGAISEFLEKSDDKTFCVDGCFVMVDLISKTMTYYGNPSSNLGVQIKQGLRSNKFLDEWRINSDNKWRKQELLKFVRLRPHLFPDRSANLNLISRIDQLEGKLKVHIVDQKDQKLSGSSTNLVDKDSKYEPIEFTLTASLFAGTAPVTFNVSIGMDINDGGFTLYLESPDLAYLIDKKAEELINAEIAKIKEIDSEIPILNK